MTTYREQYKACAELGMNHNDTTAHLRSIREPAQPNPSASFAGSIAEPSRVERKQAQAEYKRRDDLHTDAMFNRNNLVNAVRRLERSKTAPKWLKRELAGMRQTALDIQNELAKHRDEVYGRAWDGDF